MKKSRGGLGLENQFEIALIMITTACAVRGTIFDDMYEYACNVLDGTFDDEKLLSIIYELDEKKEWIKHRLPK